MTDVMEEKGNRRAERDFKNKHLMSILPHMCYEIEKTSWKGGEVFEETPRNAFLSFVIQVLYQLLRMVTFQTL